MLHTTQPVQSVALQGMQSKAMPSIVWQRRAQPVQSVALRCTTEGCASASASVRNGAH